MVKVLKRLFNNQKPEGAWKNIHTSSDDSVLRLETASMVVEIEEDEGGGLTVRMLDPPGWHLTVTPKAANSVRLQKGIA